jgi:lactobin A/cerein 7B family class IIb bacteriocin
METQINGLIELNNEELKKISGGFGFLVAVAIGLSIAAGAEIFNDWDNFKNGLAGRKESK